ncbi:metalloregulator ArsR/SmtB family transcription factor [Paenarthrobacter sp. Z7-10]|uniref:ArsR/SmtB family transcription factor n=1 Tax=Paenarthrobacter sp. Z7-10 TaxID=2787635 RepID=UPI0022A8E06A|nr:metalloregulator ArsR/SmtB family transcription factor [Paenarthrobacter sp. Z7-10]MCZ2401781.1 metalloregulator ArsR/SmtB family transcription factor [Paenarthrobacter sp. Z7-10]
MVFDDVFAVIAEETRRDILRSLKAGDKAVGELVEELGASQPTISKHLRVLREASLVTMRAEGQRRYYSLNAGPLEHISTWLASLGLDGAGRHSPPAALVPAGVAAPEAGTAGALPFTAVPVAGVPVSVPAGVPAASARTAAQLPPFASAPAPEPGGDGGRPQQLGRSVGRAANKAADLLANLPKFGRRRD